MFGEEVGKWFRKLFYKGARPDVEKELLEDGYFMKAQNMRLTATDGTQGSLTSIGGEIQYWRTPLDLQPLANGYVCIGAANVTGAETSFWCHVNGVIDPDNYPPVIVINGVVCAMSPLIPYRYDRPLQFADVNRCVDGVLYVADHNADALYWDTGAMIRAQQQGSAQFFGNFTLAQVQVLPRGPLFWFQHTGLPVVGNGLPPGQYVYFPRYIFPSGDRSNFGPPTPPIDVPRNQSPIYVFSGQYPGGQTVGGVANPNTQVPTQYGVELSFQVDNLYGASAIEVCRTRWNDGQGLEGPGITEVIARIDITPGQFTEVPLVFTDPVDQNILEVIPPDVVAQQQVNFTAPKTVDYFDNRVGWANFTRVIRVANIIWQEIAGLRVANFTSRMFTWWEGGSLKYNDGHGDPVTNTYMKSAMHNERQSLGAQLWDGTATKSYVTPIVDNHQHVSRRTRKAQQSLALSYGHNEPYGTSPDPIYATCEDVCQTNDPVTPTFDVIVQGTMAKEDNAFTNVIQGANYNPYRPTSPTDPDFLRYKQKPVISRQISASASATDAGNIFDHQYHTLGVGVYGPQNLNATAPWWEVMSIMATPAAGRVIMEGQASYELIEDQPNPNTVQRRKATNQLRCFFPDAASAVVSSSILLDMQANPQNYKLKLTPYGGYSEPYAYRNDTQGALATLFAGATVLIGVNPTPTLIGLQVGASVSGAGIQPGTIVTGISGDQVTISLPLTITNSSSVVTFGKNTYGQDLITYATMQREPGTGNSACVNIGDTTLGFQPGGSAPLSQANNIGWGAWRTLTAPTPFSAENPNPTNPNDQLYSVFQDPNNTAQGAIEIGITDIQVVAEGRGDVWRITTQQNVYRLFGDHANAEFDGDRTRCFHEGFYVVQVLRSDASVPDENIQRYTYTGTHVARERCIALGRGPGVVFTVNLFQVRVEDCVPYPNSGQYRYVYVNEGGQLVKPFICFTNSALTPAQSAAAIAAFNAGQSWTDPNGVTVYGAYTYAASTSTSPYIIHQLTFGNYGSAPALNARILARYNEQSTIRTFGFDCSIGPWTFGAYDRVFNAANGLGNSNGNTQVFNGAPLPYPGGGRATSYVLPRDGGSSTQPASIEPSSFGRIASLRQWIMYGVLTTRTPGWMNTSSGDPLTEQWAFPHRHYIIKPSLLTSSLDGLGNGLSPLWDLDYPGEMVLNFGRGGFQFTNGFNLDYARPRLIGGLGIPRNGQLPSTDGCNLIIVSLQKQQGAIDSPGLQTFIEDNLFPISEENGEIKVIRALDQGDYQQLWGWVEKGVFRIPYNKNILVGADGNTLGTQAVSQFWPREELWVSRGSKGMPDQMWRMAIKCNAPVGSGDIDTVFWTDRVSAYQLVGGRVVDIARGKYLSELQPILEATPADYRPGYAAMYNLKNGEWWLSTFDMSTGEPVKKVIVFNAINREWIGEFTYDYDQYLAINTDMYGYRDLSANKLDEGFTLLTPLGTVPLEKYAENVFVPYAFRQSELIKWRTGPGRPDELRIYDKDHVLMVLANAQTQEAADPGTGQYWVLNIDEWEQMMNNVDATYDPARTEPPQSTRYYMRVYNRTAEKFVITFAELQSRQIA